MEEMRFLARARNLDEIWGVATSLYDWQFVHYSRLEELTGGKDFYTVSQTYPCYVKDNQYTYSDMDMKMIIAILKSILRHCFKKQQEFVKDMVVEPSAMQ